MTPHTATALGYSNSVQTNYLGVLLIAIFIINPFISIILGIILLTSKKRYANADLNIWCILVAAWLSLINLTKVPESDQVMYIEWYKNCVNTNLIDGIFYYSGKLKEPAYGIFQYACNILFDGNVKLFTFTVSFVNYSLLFFAVKIILLKARQGIRAVIFGIICISFFNQFFYISIHLIRQVMAFSIALYAIALHVKDGKNHWIILACAPLVHSTAALFSLLAIIPFIYHRMNLRQYVLLSIPLLISTVGSIAFGSMMLLVVGEDSMAGYAFYRMSSAADDGLESSPVVVAIMLIPLLTISIITLLRLRRNRSYNSALYPILYLFLFLAILILSMSARPLVQYRFVFVTYQMMPFLLPLLLSPKNRLRNLYFVGTGTMFILRFFLTLNNSTFSYNITTGDLIYLPAPLYFSI